MAVAPSEFPPPFDAAEAIGPPTDPADERIEVGIAIVGGERPEEPVQRGTERAVVVG